MDAAGARSSASKRFAAALTEAAVATAPGHEYTPRGKLPLGGSNRLEGRLQMKKLYCLVLAIGGWAALSTTAAAAGPVRDPSPSSPIHLDGVCAFPLTLTFPIDKEFVTSFSNSSGTVVKQIITGRLVVTFTNDNTGKFLTSNFSGPSQLTFYTDGTPKEFAFEGPQGGALNGTVFLGAGRTVFEFAPDGTLTSQTQVGHFTDVCAALS
jgi:hypothetical protein